MLKRFTALAGVTLLLGLISAPAAHADTRFSLRIGPGYSSPARSGYVWQEGYRVWTGYGYRWVPGRWVPAYGGWGRERWRDSRAFRFSWNSRGRNSYRDRDRRGDYDRGRNRDGASGWRR